MFEQRGSGGPAAHRGSLGGGSGGSVRGRKEGRVVRPEGLGDVVVGNDGVLVHLLGERESSVGVSGDVLW